MLSMCREKRASITEKNPFCKTGNVSNLLLSNMQDHEQNIALLASSADRLSAPPRLSQAGYWMSVPGPAASVVFASNL